MKENETKIIAHRGFSGQYPENTLIAFQKAIEIDADYIELDVHKTKDNVIVVIHDESVYRTAYNNEKGLISQMNFNDLSEVSVGYSAKFGDQFINEKIPTLKEVLELAKGKIKVCIEIKIHNVEKEILQIIEEMKMEKEVIIFSFYDDVLQQVRSLNESITTLFLVEEFSDDALKIAQEMGCFAIGVGNEKIIDEKLINLVHSKNVEIWQWTIDNEKQMQKLINLGLNGLITNKPDIALNCRKALI